jgi:hypothetical protein
LSFFAACVFYILRRDTGGNDTLLAGAAGKGEEG